MPVTLPCNLPTPQELMRDPELAALTILEAAMHVAMHAIIAENMELSEQDDSPCHPRHIRPSTKTAGDILDKLQELWLRFELYRRQRNGETSTTQTEDIA